jgi:hypothetical protein
MERRLSYKKEYTHPGSVYFRYVGNITEDGAMKLQERAGYHPAGYGFYEFAYINGTARWHCSNNCD